MVSLCTYRPGACDALVAYTALACWHTLTPDSRRLSLLPFPPLCVSIPNAIGEQPIQIDDLLMVR
jgi:hypothetical protein